jgi:ankyrin repeat protein
VAGQTNLYTAQTLAELGVELERKDTCGLTALFWAAKKGQDGALRTLVHLGAAVDGRDGNRRTALWPLAERGQVAAVRMLCSQGCQVNALDAKGASVAHFAAAKNQVRRAFQVMGHGPRLSCSQGQVSLKAALAFVNSCPW